MGYKIVETNYKNRIGEIDIIALDKSTIVFVEVKTRLSAAFGLPQEAVNLKKQQKIFNTAQLYLMQTHQFGKPCRFDVIAILGDEDYKLNHIINAF